MPFFRRKGRDTPETVAAVDLGSNSFHLVVARRSNGEVMVVDRLKEMVRLAEGQGRNGELAPASRARALECLARFGQRLRELPDDGVRAVGTNTLRRLPRDDTFFTEAGEALGYPIEVVSGVEEARLVYLGVTDSLADNGPRRLVVDIGGGSTELILGEGKRPLQLESLHMGCVSFTQRYFPGGGINKTAWRRAEQAVLMELEPVAGRFRQGGWADAIGTSGTIRAVQSVVRAQGWNARDVSADSLGRLCEMVQTAGSISRLRLPGLAADRRPVFAGGVVILGGVFRALGIERMRVSDGALREGLLHDLVGRLLDADTRDASVAGLAYRYHVDAPQAARVRATAAALFANAAASWSLDGEDERLLHWAAELHEIGLDIAHGQYHRHGEYIARHADLAGFSRQDQARLAALVRSHRRKLRRSVFKALPTRGRDRLIRLAVLLRLAAVLHRGRHADPLPDLGLAVEEDMLELRIPRDWLQAHPLTLADLDEESRYLQAAGFSLSVDGGAGRADD